MSSSSTLVTAEHFDYIARRTTPEDGFLARLRRAAVEEGLPAIWISAEQASFLQILLRLCGAREVVEVGTLAGYSAIWMARALPAGGCVRTIELVDRHADFAERWIAESDVADRIELLRGDGRSVLTSMETGSADAAFIDADKEGYRAYLDECLRIVRPGGLLLCDNAFAFGQLLDDEADEASVAALREFNDHVAGLAGLRSVIVPLGDGCWVGVKE